VSEARSARPELRVRLLREGAVVPAYQTEHAAGMDLYACPAEPAPIVIEPGSIGLVACGIAIAIPFGYEGQVRPRSGLATRYGITLANTPGTIDADYRGEVMVPLINLGREAFTVEPAMRIAQLVIAPVSRVEVRAVEDLAELGRTERGTGGFGSTGLG
jgi:dUTP pyrophosphatase